MDGGPHARQIGPLVSGAHRRRWLRLAWAAVLCLVGLEILGATGLLAVADENLRRLYYGVRGEREGPTDVVFVAIDEQTVDAWEAPPWTWDRYVGLIAAIEGGDPRAIAVLEPGPRLLAEELAGGRPAALERMDDLVLPPPNPGLGQPRLRTDATGDVRAVQLEDLSGPNATARALAVAGVRVPSGEALPVNFAASPERLPTVPAHRVASGEIPPETFAGRIAVIGLRGERFAPQVPTPVGTMSPAEVHAHAVLSATRGALWAPVPWWASTLFDLALILLGLVVTLRFEHGRAAIGLVAAGVVLLVLDYQLFARGWLRLGATSPIFGLLGGVGAALAIERRIAREDVRALARAVGSRLRLYAQDRRAGDGDEAFFERFARASRTYVDYESAVLAELVPGSWRLKFRATVGLSHDQIYERRRDVRRDPYQAAYVALRPTWASRPFLKPELGQKTLVVPLVALSRLLGVWIVNVREHAELGDSDLAIIDGLASQLSVALERRRLARFVGATERPSGLLSDGQLVAQVREARHLIDSLVHDREELDSLVEQLPVGVLVATVWGEIELINERMRRFVASFGIDDARQIELVELLGKISGEPPEATRATLRKQLLDREAIALTGRSRGMLGSGSSYRLELVPTSPSADEGRLPTGFVVTLNVIAEAELEEVEWRWKRPDASVAAPVDVRTILRRTAQEIEESGSSRPVMLEMPDRAPRARIDSERLSEALDHVLGELSAAGSDEPGWVRVAHDDDAVIIRVADPSLTVTASELSRLYSGEAAPGSPIHRLARARELLAGAAGELEVESDLQSGTTVVIRIPREG